MMPGLVRLLSRLVRWGAAVPPAELLVLIGVVLVGLALLIPWLQWSRDTARGVVARDNLRRLGTAMGSYHDSFQRFPQMGRGGGPRQTDTGLSGAGTQPTGLEKSREKDR